MTRFLMIVVLLLVSALVYPQDEAATSPSPEGDTRMGSDAANSGTNVSDQELQAEEEKGNVNHEQNGVNETDFTEIYDSHINVK